MRIAGMSSTNYYAMNLNASSNMNVNSLFKEPSLNQNSYLDYPSLLGSGNKVLDKPNLNDMLTTVYQFSSTLKTSTMSMQNAVSAILGFSSDAAAEKQKTGNVSSETAENLYKVASTFAGAYNSSVNSLYYAPSYSSFVQGVEKSLRGAVDNNLTALKDIGFSQVDDGKLSIDKEKFTKALQENPDALKNLFGNNSNFTNALDNANSQAMDSRSINKAEISLAVRENYMSYMGYGSQNGYSASSSFLSNMLFSSFA